MKKKVLLFAAATLICLSAGAAVMGMKWAKVSDPCGKCVINDTTRKCGKCGGFMNSTSSDDLPDNWVKSTYTCKECGHSCIYKCKN